MKRTLITTACLLLMLFGSVSQADARWFWRPKPKPKPVPAETYERGEIRFSDGTRIRYERYTRNPAPESSLCGARMSYGTGGELSAEFGTVRAAGCAIAVVKTVEVAACKVFTPSTWGDCFKEMGRLLDIDQPALTTPAGQAGPSSGREPRAKGVNLLQPYGFRSHDRLSAPPHTGH